MCVRIIEPCEKALCWHCNNGDPWKRFQMKRYWDEPDVTKTYHPDSKQPDHLPLREDDPIVPRLRVRS